MSQLTNAALTPYHQTGFSHKVTLHPILLGIEDDNDISNKLNSQLYLPIKRNEVAQCVESLQKLYDWPENWDSYDAQPPKRKAVNFAINLIWEMFDLSYTLGCAWSSPNISADSNGNVSLEWWGKNDKKITLYVNENNQIEYIKSSTANISEMEDEILNGFDVDTYQGLFGWLDE